MRSIKVFIPSIYYIIVYVGTILLKVLLTFFINFGITKEITVPAVYLFIIGRKNTDFFP